ncbi:MAG: hypothetical protein ABIZ09_06380, partial [Rhodoferax sp.]
MRQPIFRGCLPLRPLQMVAVVCALLGIVSCATAGPGPAQGGDREGEAALLSKINASIGQAPCNADDQCRTIGIGANACGGPVAWRPWSTVTNGSGEYLQGLADQLSDLQRRRQAQDGMVSTCLYRPNPGAHCQLKRCV